MSLGRNPQPLRKELKVYSKRHNKRLKGRNRKYPFNKKESSKEEERREKGINQDLQKHTWPKGKQINQT